MNSKILSLSKILGIIIGFGAIFFVIFVPFFLFSWPGTLDSSYDLASLNYSQSITKVADVISQEESLDGFDPDCHTRSKLQGNKTNKSVLLFHGFTNCPQQYSILSEQISSLGYNVYIPRMPTHGYLDKKSEIPNDLKSEDLVRFVKESVQITAGLGDEVIILGISGGAGLASWALNFLDDVDKSISVAPLYSPYFASFDLQVPMYRLASVTPTGFYYWEEGIEEVEERKAGPQYAYLGFWPKSISQFLRISIDLRESLENSRQDLSNKHLVHITVSGDEAINKEAVDYYQDLFTKAGAKTDDFNFSTQYNLEHDILDPNQSFADIESVYPVLLSYL